MINTLKGLFGFGPKVDYAELIKKEAQLFWMCAVKVNSRKGI